MVTKRKVMTQKIKPDYTRSKSGCMVYTIEVVLAHDTVVNDSDVLLSAIDTLQQMGAAEIVQVDQVSESWDDACRILRQRMVQ